MAREAERRSLEGVSLHQVIHEMDHWTRRGVGCADLWAVEEISQSLGTDKDQLVLEERSPPTERAKHTANQAKELRLAIAVPFWESLNCGSRV